MYENEALKWNFMNPNKLSRGFYYCLIWHLPLSYEFKFTQEVQQIMNPNQRIFDFMFSVLLSLYYSFSVRLIYKWKKKQEKHTFGWFGCFQHTSNEYFIYVNIQSRAITHTTFQNVNTYLMVAAMSKDKQTHTHMYVHNIRGTRSKKPKLHCHFGCGALLPPGK